MTGTRYDLGNGHSAYLTMWSPGDLELNPQNVGKAEIDPVGLIIEHADGCHSSILFDLPGVAELWPKYDRWALKSLDPLHVEPSIKRDGLKNCPERDHSACRHHNHHGHIRAGQWQPCPDDLGPT